ncbi:hypothetical protein PIB30_063073 [Stylosanthes scabra]|uniref:Uncharacterized protein n=1 Tax=Stylosanthes scabra TaxID=79078 RepID=A0ABU6SMB0_9FABA|nr:hypothetical protein [Stylosanthes scabra]
MASSSSTVSIFDAHCFRMHTMSKFSIHMQGEESKLLVQEFYANAAVSDEEAAGQEELPYTSFIRGKEIDFSPNNIRRVMRLKRETVGKMKKGSLRSKERSLEAILWKSPTHMRGCWRICVHCLE